MAKATTDNDTENTADVPEDATTTPTRPEGASINVVPVGPITSTAAPTLDEAFTLLCEALKERLSEDLPAQLHCEEIQGWYANGGGNEALAWGHAILLLEQVVGVPLRG